jgi:hypothetical protein
MAVPSTVTGDAAWHRLKADASLQFSFPDAPPVPATPQWLRDLAALLSRHGEALKYFGWVLLGLAVLFAAFVIIRALHRREIASAAASPTPPLAPWQPSPERARLLLIDADALAAQGRYAEAAHLLLRICIQEIGERRPGAVAPAFTAREIARLEALTPRARSVFSAIALVVERCLFGGRALVENDFAQVRAEFAQFAATDLWAAA